MHGIRWTRADRIKPARRGTPQQMAKLCRSLTRVARRAAPPSRVNAHTKHRVGSTNAFRPCPQVPSLLERTAASALGCFPVTHSPRLGRRGRRGEQRAPLARARPLRAAGRQFAARGLARIMPDALPARPTRLAARAPARAALPLHRAGRAFAAAAAALAGAGAHRGAARRARPPKTPRTGRGHRARAPVTPTCSRPARTPARWHSSDARGASSCTYASSAHDTYCSRNKIRLK